MDAACTRGIGSYSNSNPRHNNSKLSTNMVNKSVSIKASKRIPKYHEFFSLLTVTTIFKKDFTLTKLAKVTNETEMTPRKVSVKATNNDFSFCVPERCPGGGLPQGRGLSQGGGLSLVTAVHSVKLPPPGDFLKKFFIPVTELDSIKLPPGVLKKNCLHFFLPVTEVHSLKPPTPEIFFFSYKCVHFF